MARIGKGNQEKLISWLETQLMQIWVVNGSLLMEMKEEVRSLSIPTEIKDELLKWTQDYNTKLPAVPPVTPFVPQPLTSSNLASVCSSFDMQARSAADTSRQRNEAAQSATHARLNLYQGNSTGNKITL